LTWQALFVVRVLVLQIPCTILIKRTAGLGSRTRRLVWQYLLAALFASVFAVAQGAPVVIPDLPWIVLAGFGNGIACYFFWRAYDINLSKTSLFSIARDVIAMALGYVLLEETRYLSGWVIVGVFLSILSALMLSVRGTNGSDQARASVNRTLLIWVLLFSVIWGVTDFSVRYFSFVRSVHTATFLCEWYVGSFIGAVAVLLLAGKAEAGARLQTREIAPLALLAALICISFYLTYEIIALAPITIVLPLLRSSDLIAALLIGLYLFGERRELSGRECWATVIGIVGGLTLAFQF